MWFTLLKMKGFFNDDYKKMQQEFPHIFQRMMLRGRGLAIFDDLMTELADCDLLVHSTQSGHTTLNISSIHVTQNVFHRGSGKYQGDNSTLYLNTKYLMSFLPTQWTYPLFASYCQETRSSTC